MEKRATSRTILSKIPGGGMMYFYKRIETKDEDGKNDRQLSCLGCGGFAATMDCIRVQGVDEIPVAIKQASLDRKAAERFQSLEFRGLHATRAISHPNVVKYLGYFQGDDGDGKIRMSFVFERCPIATPFPVPLRRNPHGYLVPVEPVRQPVKKLVGCDLASNGIKTAPFRPREARHIIAQILKALSAFHGVTPPVVHRDVKPENILVWNAVKDTLTDDILLHVKLADYNTVRRLDGRDLTVAAGTRCFMAPEANVQTGYCGRAVKPVARYDCSADIFSAGATFFYLISKHAPAPDTNLPWKKRFGNRKIMETSSLRSHAKAGNQTATALLQKREHLPEGIEEEFAQLVEDEDITQMLEHTIGGYSVRELSVLFPSVLEFFFPQGSLERQFLEGLICLRGERDGDDTDAAMVMDSPMVDTPMAMAASHGLDTPLAPVIEEDVNSVKNEQNKDKDDTLEASQGALEKEETSKFDALPLRWTANEALEWLDAHWKDE